MLDSEDDIQANADSDVDVDEVRTVLYFIVIMSFSSVHTYPGRFASAKFLASFKQLKARCNSADKHVGDRSLIRLYFVFIAQGRYARTEVK